MKSANKSPNGHIHPAQRTIPIITTGKTRQREDLQDEVGMGFDEQYERMIKRQLGGMLDQYAAFGTNYDDSHIGERNKQTDNMIEVLKEFSTKFKNEQQPRA